MKIILSTSNTPSELSEIMDGIDSEPYDKL